MPSDSSASEPGSSDHDLAQLLETDPTAPDGRAVTLFSSTVWIQSQFPGSASRTNGTIDRTTITATAWPHASHAVRTIPPSPNMQQPSTRGVFTPTLDPSNLSPPAAQTVTIASKPSYKGKTEAPAHPSGAPFRPCIFCEEKLDDRTKLVEHVTTQHSLEGYEMGCECCGQGLHGDVERLRHFIDELCPVVQQARAHFSA